MGYTSPNLKSRVFACLLGASLWAVAPRARAEGAEERAAAEAAFAEGVKLLEAGDVAAACRQFESATELSDRNALGGLMMLADCYAKQGRIASAWATYKEVAAKAQRAGQSERERTATERGAELEPRLPRLRLVLGAGFKQVDGLVLRQNGALLPLSLLSRPVPVDPGRITIEVSAPGFETFSKSVLADEGHVTEVEVSPLKKIPEEANSAERGRPVPVPSRTATAPPDAGAASNGDHTLAYVVGGVGIAGVVTSGVLGLIAKSNYDAAYDDGSCATEGSGVVCDDPDGVNSARNLGNVATYVFAGGVAVTAVGAILYLLTPGDTAKTEAGADSHLATLRPNLAFGARAAWFGIGGTL